MLVEQKKANLDWEADDCHDRRPQLGLGRDHPPPGDAHDRDDCHEDDDRRGGHVIQNKNMKYQATSIKHHKQALPRKNRRNSR